MRKKFWITFVVSLILFSAGFIKVSPYILDTKTSDIIKKDDVNAENVNEDEVKAEGEILFLLMGIDDVEGVGGVDIVKDKVKNADTRYTTTGLRSDTMILCKYNFDTGEATLLSIPRDTRTYIRTRKNEDKINHAHAFGGPNLSVDAVRDLLGINLDFYVTVDYRAVKEIVNEIGGVDIYVPRNMYYTDPTAGAELYINLEEGQQILDGDKALQFLRFRSYPEGDLGRVEAQQSFMKALAKQLLQTSTLLKLPSLANTYFEYVDTNISLGTVLKGITSIGNVNFDNLETVTLKGEYQTIDGVSYFIYDENELKLMVDNYLREFKQQ